MTPKQIDQFIRLGYVKIENAFPTELARRCCDLLWEEVQLSPDDPKSWIKPVIRITEMKQAPFRQSVNTSILLEAYGQLAGDNWLPRDTMGTFPIRFPSEEKPIDTGWHVDASFPGDDPDNYLEWRINSYSKGRALLMLFLFSDVIEDDAPTIIREGSHLDVASLLEPYGEQGLSFMQLAQQLDNLPERNLVTATGTAGTVYLCHPLIVHAAQEHRGKNPKLMAQPPLLSKHDFNSSKAINECCPIERAIKIGNEK